LEINEWTKSKTNGKVSKLFDGNYNQKMRMIHFIVLGLILH